MSCMLTKKKTSYITLLFKVKKKNHFTIYIKSYLSLSWIPINYNLNIFLILLRIFLVPQINYF